VARAGLGRWSAIKRRVSYTEEHSRQPGEEWCGLRKVRDDVLGGSREDWGRATTRVATAAHKATKVEARGMPKVRCCRR